MIRSAVADRAALAGKHRVVAAVESGGPAGRRDEVARAGAAGRRDEVAPVEAAGQRDEVVRAGWRGPAWAARVVSCRRHPVLLARASGLRPRAEKAGS